MVMLLGIMISLGWKMNAELSDDFTKQLYQLDGRFNLMTSIRPSVKDPSTQSSELFQRLKACLPDDNNI